MDQTFLPLIIIALFLIPIIFIIVYSIKKEKKRKEDIKEYANRRGFTFQDTDLIIMQSRFNLFNQGHSKKLSNLISNNELKIFDYKYTTGGGKNSNTSNQTIVLQDKFQIPDFILKKENLFHKVGNLIGYKDIDFSNYPDFSKKYFLKGEQIERIKTLFTPEKIRHFEQLSLNFILEARNNQMIFYIPGKRIKIIDLDNFILNAKITFDMFKR